MCSMNTSTHMDYKFDQFWGILGDFRVFQLVGGNRLGYYVASTGLSVVGVMHRTCVLG